MFLVSLQNQNPLRFFSRYYADFFIIGKSLVFDWKVRQRLTVGEGEEGLDGVRLTREHQAVVGWGRWAGRHTLFTGWSWDANKEASVKTIFI